MMKKYSGKIALIVALLMLVTVCLTSCGSNEKKVEEVKEAVEQKVEEAKEAVEEKVDEAKEAAEGAAEAVSEKVDEVKETVEEKVDEAKEAVEGAAEAVGEKVDEVKETVEEKVDEAKEAVEGAAEAVSETVEEAKETVEEAAAAVEEKAEEAKEAVEEAVAEAALMSHADYAAAELEAPVYVETYVQATQSWWDGKITIYAQSEDGAYFIYNAACSEEDAAKLVPGARIRVSGFKAEWAGEIEIADATIEFLDGDAFVAEAFDATDLLDKEELADHQNEKVSFKGLTVAAQDDGAAFSYKNAENKTDDLYVRFTKDDGTYNFCVEFYLCGNDTEVYKAVEGLQVGDVVDIEGFLYWYNGANVHMTAVTKAE